jgi:hypothetical protein
VITQYCFTLEVTLRAPFLQSGLAQASIGFDATPLRDQRGRLIISGDQIEGFVRAVMIGALGENCDESVAKINKWFGSEGVQINNGMPTEAARSRVKIFDLVGPNAPQQWHSYSRIRLDEESGATNAGALQVIAQSHKPGEEVSFSGKGWVLADTKNEAAAFIGWVRAALTIVPALGAIKSGGFGEVVKAVVGDELTSSPLAPAQAKDSAMNGCALQLCFDQPFLVDPDQRSGNVYESAEIIPGNIIKGAIADMLTLGGKMSDYDDLLSKLTIRHAFPGEKRPEIAPLSLAFVGEKLVDLLECAADGVPKFQTDWKVGDWKEAKNKDWYSPDALPRYVRTRTAVNANNIAADQQLFSQRMIETDGKVWNSALLLPETATEDEKRTLGALVALLEKRGILRIGKTAAPVKVVPSKLIEAEELGEDSWRITLQTPAWMIPPSVLHNQDVKATATNDARSYYEAYFKGHGLTLVNFMALQSWWGGARAVGPRSALSGQYCPWLLTRAGSTFIVKNGDPKMLTEWNRFGLPQPKHEARDWKNCAFVRENGFGEIRAERHNVR